MAYGNKEFNFYTHPMESLMFFDIETVARVPELMEGTALYDSFEYKMRYAEEAQRKDFSAYNLKALYASKAALYPEFGKIVAITIGKIVDGNKLALYTFSGDDEADILTRFFKVLGDKILEDPSLALCGVNLKFFDLRYCFIRGVVHQIEPVKKHINLTGLKPWEVFTADLTDVWKQTSMYNAPLVSMAECLGLPSPKSDIDGSQVSDTYWKEGKEGLERIVKYCERDVFTTANIARKLRFEPLLEMADPKAPKTKDEGVSEGVSEAVKPKKELAPLLELLYSTDNFSAIESKLREKITRKKIFKNDFQVIGDIIKGVYIKNDFVNGNQDSKAVKEQKIAEIDEFINSLKK